MSIKPWLALALALLVSQGAQAQFYAGVEGSATRLDEPRWRGQGLGVIGGWVANDYIAFEVGLRRLGSDNMASREAAGHLVEATGLLRIPFGGIYNAYARAGMAQLRGSLAGQIPNGDKARGLIGLGLHVVVSEPLSLRFELQRVGSGLVGLRAGVVYPF